MKHLHDVQQAQYIVEQLINQVGSVILGKRAAIEKMVIALLCGGHVLLEDVPGVGKTKLVRTLAQSIDSSFKRIQFTPDLLPSDVTGLTIYNQQEARFEFRPGPIMANIVLADEVNRTSPRTQSALLEAMEERSITVDGTTYELPQPFILIATQNPVEFEGTYRLPEAQLDRFMFQIQLGYPSHAAEVELLSARQQTKHMGQLKPVLYQEELLFLQKLVSKIHVDPTLQRYIVHLSAATRQHPQIQLGVSPRGSVALMKAAQGHALLRGRSFIIPDDIKQMLPAVFTHRLLVKSSLPPDEGDLSTMMQQLLTTIPVPNMQFVAAR